MFWDLGYSVYIIKAMHQKKAMTMTKIQLGITKVLLQNLEVSLKTNCPLAFSEITRTQRQYFDQL